jgi:hypothetical protein
MIEQEAWLGERAYRPVELLDDLRASVWRELGGRGPIDTYRRNLQRGYLRAMHHLLHEAESRPFQPPESGNLRVSSEDDPPLNAELHIADSDIRPLVRDQLVRLRAEVRRALPRSPDRMTRIHLEDVLHRIGETLDPTL